jgi:hypothetical protein
MDEGFARHSCTVQVQRLLIVCIPARSLPAEVGGSALTCSQELQSASVEIQLDPANYFCRRNQVHATGHLIHYVHATPVATVSLVTVAQG